MGGGGVGGVVVGSAAAAGDGGGGGGASVEGSRAAGQVLDAPRLKFSLTLRATSLMGRWKFALSSSSVRLFDCPLPRFCEV